MESGKGCKGSTNAAEPPSAYGKGHDIETNGFEPDTRINWNANYGAKTADPSYGVANKPIGSYELEINTPSRSSYVTGTSRTGMAAGAEENIWLKAGNGTGVSGTPGRKVPGSLGSTGLDVGKPKVPDVPEIAGRGVQKDSSEHLPGAYGTQTQGSLTIKRNGKTERVDVENMDPGKIPGNVHYHESDNTKWRYDIGTGQLINPNTKEIAPPRVQRITKENWFKKAIKKAMKILGE